jgi:hypothetical protein
VTETAELLRALRRIRRRARGLAALEGAVAGAAVALAVLALGVVAWRARGATVPWRLATLWGAGAAGLGAAFAATRPIPLARCARLVDAAIDRGGAATDRVLSALSFAGAEAAAPPALAPLARAAISDASARARRCTPALVAPARRPASLPAFAGAALALVVVGAWPARAPGARRDAGRLAASEPTEPRLHVAADALEAERAELVAAAEAAAQTGDVNLRALAREARATLDALAEGALGRGEALDRLTDLAARAKEAADEAAAERAALRAAGKALEPTAATRALGRALGGDDPEATTRALDALAARAEASDGARAEIASALGTAAAGVASGAGEDAAGGAGQEGRRRLNRPGAATGDARSDGGRGDAGARRLESLKRDLEDASAGCRGGAADCAKRLRDDKGGLRGAARDAAGAAERRRLESAVRQMRERLRRGDLEEGSRERRFGRVARGEQRPSPGQKGERGGERGGQEGGQEGAEAVASDEGGGSEGGEAGEEVFVDDPSGDAAAGASTKGAGTNGAASAAAESAAVAGNGVGHEAGGDPLGAGSTPPTRGREREVRVRSSAGPTRSEVIESSARRGFATRDYVRVFGDYQPVVEEALASGAVPEGRRYVVRRYFQLIRPRAGARDARTP